MSKHTFISDTELVRRKQNSDIAKFRIILFRIKHTKIREQKFFEIHIIIQNKWPFIG